MAIRKDYRPEKDATVVTRLRVAGAVMLGKLQMTEGAFGVHHPTSRSIRGVLRTGPAHPQVALVLRPQRVSVSVPSALIRLAQSGFHRQ
jgi:Asp-tRNA(Asn)/Glu-tRNA(Gln) amidotransferase A subunit family amidase